MKNFKKVDITHHSKRTQAGNIAKAGTAYDVVMGNSSGLVIDNDGVSSITKSNVPQNVTLETAIKFFRENAKGECSKLFSQTADWLDKYRVASRTAMNKLLKEAEQSNEGAEDNTLTVDMSEVK